MRALQQRQRNAALSAAFDALEEAERYVMEAIYDRGIPLREIGDTLGVSESRVSQMSAEIVAKLKRRLQGMSVLRSDASESTRFGALRDAAP